MRKLLILAAGAVVLTAVAGVDKERTSASAETYRLVHSIGNSEKTIQTGMTLSSCQSEREERKAIVDLLAAGGTVTCLPDSDFVG